MSLKDHSTNSFVNFTLLLFLVFKHLLFCLFTSICYFSILPLVVSFNGYSFLHDLSMNVMNKNNRNVDINHFLLIRVFIPSDVNKILFGIIELRYFYL